MEAIITIMIFLSCMTFSVHAQRKEINRYQMLNQKKQIKLFINSEIPIAHDVLYRNEFCYSDRVVTRIFAITNIALVTENKKSTFIDNFKF